MKPLSLVWRAARELGIRPVIEFGLYHAALRSGYIRLRTPSYTWQKRPLSTWLEEGRQDPKGSLQRRRGEPPARFFFRTDKSFQNRLREIVGNRTQLVTGEADAILRGVFPVFGMAQAALGHPPDWSLSASLDDQEPPARWELDSHWTESAHSGGAGDIKLLWEPARFAWLYSLARAFVLSADQRYAEGAWTLIDSWRSANAPNMGPHWESGQEVALRIFALLFADAAFKSAWSAYPERRITTAEMLAVHAARIPPTMLYARAQGNNHLLVEAAGLYTVGLLYPCFKHAHRWKRIGRSWLLRALETQVFEDGGYVQHSFNYQRLALQVGLWSASLSELNGEPLPEESLDRLRGMLDLLRSFTSSSNGRLPNFGPNDGAHVFPWSTCGFLDYRPTIQAGAQALTDRRAYPDGPWDEASLWFGLDPAGRTEATEGRSLSSTHRVNDTDEPQRETYSAAGLHMLAGNQARGWLRCGVFKTRPGHSDQLHFGLWWGAQPVAIDAGSYRYKHAPPWDNALAEAAMHNTLVVGGEDPMRRAGRFLWLDWAQACTLGRWRSRGGALELLAARHDGYSRWGLTHRRCVVRAGDDLWLVVDDLLGDGEHEASIGWLLKEGRWEWTGTELVIGYDNVEATIRISVDAARVGVYRAGDLVAGVRVAHESPCWGWHSPTYAVREPALRLAASAQSDLPLRFLTWWSFNDADPEDLKIVWQEGYADGQAPMEGLEWDGERLSIDDAYLVDPSSLRSFG